MLRELGINILMMCGVFASRDVGENRITLSRWCRTTFSVKSFLEWSCGTESVARAKKV